MYFNDSQAVPDWFLKLCVPVTGLAGLFLGRLWDSHSANKKQRAEIIDRYLSQLQIAVEILSSRISGAVEKPESYDSNPQYFRDTNVYAIGRVLAIERLIMEEGVYSTLHRHSRRYRRLNWFLQENRLDSKLIGLNFHRFERTALAESLIEYSGGKHSVIGPDKFAQICAERKSKGQSLPESAWDVVPQILNDPEKTTKLLNMLKGLSDCLARETHIRVETPRANVPKKSHNL